MYGFIGRCIHVLHACGYSTVCMYITLSVWQSEPIPPRLTCPLEYEYCRDVFCTNNGRCIHGECVCSPGYTGAGCEFEICKFYFYDMRNGPHCDIVFILLLRLQCVVILALSLYIHTVHNRVHCITVEPLLKDSLNKGHHINYLPTKDTF